MDCFTLKAYILIEFAKTRYFARSLNAFYRNDRISKKQNKFNFIGIFKKKIKLCNI